MLYANRPLPNRVTPFGRFEATPHRGLLIGNRGILHDEAGRFGAARWRHPHWIACALEYKGWRRNLLQPGTWTELFFLDEATALAAGHRPCALCRRADYERWREAWQRAFGLERRPSAIAMDRALHAARIEGKAQRHHSARLEMLPDGTMIESGGDAWLVLGNELLKWSHAGYSDRRRRSGDAVRVITPSPAVACLKAGYSTLLHSGAISKSPLSPCGRGPG
ncbi:MAG TPA: hypothetical protein VJL84_02265 [Kiloniellales bacterium]|nr:hypothetical protein [Kiloniellales bacterium]